MGMNEEVTFKQAMRWMAVSVSIVLTLCVGGWLYYRYVRDSYANDDAYKIVALVQTTPEIEGLKTHYLAELLDLSIDHPTNLYRFNRKEAKRKLLSSPLIKQAKVRKIRPGTVHVDYVPRKPIAFLLDYSNTALDSDGYIFPFKPFFTPKTLPELFLGLHANPEASSHFIWGEQIQDPHFRVALAVLTELQASCCSKTTQLQRIDVSKIDSTSYGKREIVVMLEEHQEQKIQDKTVLLVAPYILRLHPEDYISGLKRFALLRDHQLQQLRPLHEQTQPSSSIARLPSTIVDLRLKDLAFFSLFNN